MHVVIGLEPENASKATRATKIYGVRQHLLQEIFAVIHPSFVVNAEHNVK